MAANPNNFLGLLSSTILIMNISSSYGTHPVHSNFFLSLSSNSILIKREVGCESENCDILLTYDKCYFLSSVGYRDDYDDRLWS